jgi:hypothetical protein
MSPPFSGLKNKRNQRVAGSKKKRPPELRLNFNRLYGVISQERIYENLKSYIKFTWYEKNMNHTLRKRRYYFKNFFNNIILLSLKVNHFSSTQLRLSVDSFFSAT